MTSKPTSIDERKLFDADCKLLRKKLAIERNATRRPRIGGNFVQWEPWR